VKTLAQIAVGESSILPEPDPEAGHSLEGALARRRSCRRYADRPLALEQVSQLLWAAQGQTHARGLRTAASAGACYPLELDLVSAQGVFRYLPPSHGLRKRLEGDLRFELAQACLGQVFMAEAPAIFCFSAVYERTTGRYGERGLRYVHMDAGIAAQNLHLQAEALGLGSVAIGAFNDEEVARVLGLPAAEKPLYLVPAGYAR
jgi:SagB-type dehydrogenase family enzyme